MSSSPEASKNKLSDLMRMVRRDRAERHVKDGMAAADRRDWAQAVEELARASEAFQELGDERRMSVVLSTLALCRFGAGDLEGAEADARLSVSMMRAVQDRDGEGTALLGLGNVQLVKGDLEEAEQSFCAAASLFRAEHDWDGVTRAYLGLERALRARGKDEEAEEARSSAEAARRRLVDGL